MPSYAFEGPTWATSTITWSFAAAAGDFSNSITGGPDDPDLGTSDIQGIPTST